MLKMLDLLSTEHMFIEEFHFIHGRDIISNFSSRLFKSFVSDKAVTQIDISPHDIVMIYSKESYPVINNEIQEVFGEQNNTMCIV